MDRFDSRECVPATEIPREVPATLNLLHSNLDGLQAMISDFEARLGTALNEKSEVSPKASERVSTNTPISGAIADAAYKVSTVTYALESILRRLEL